MESYNDKIISSGALNYQSTCNSTCQVNLPLIPNITVCKSCKLVGHTRTSHRDCLYNKDRSENQIPELINMNVFCFV